MAFHCVIQAQEKQLRASMPQPLFLINLISSCDKKKKDLHRIPDLDFGVGIEWGIWNLKIGKSSAGVIV